MSLRRRSDDDPRNPGLAEALARWDTAQDWMRAQTDPGSDPADQTDAPVDPTGAMPPAAPIPNPMPPPPAGSVHPGGPAGPDNTLHPHHPGAATEQGDPVDPAAPWRSPWAAQNPAPERWRRRPGLDEHRVEPPSGQPWPGQAAGWQLPPAPPAPPSWDTLLSAHTPHSGKEQHPMSTPATGGEADQPRQSQPPVPGGEQGSAEPAAPGHDSPEQAPSPPAQDLVSIWESAPLPWEPAAQQPNQPGSADGRRPEERTQLMQPPPTQAPPWEAAGWGTPPGMDPGYPQADPRYHPGHPSGVQPATPPGPPPAVHPTPPVVPPPPVPPTGPTLQANPPAGQPWLPWQQVEPESFRPVAGPPSGGHPVVGPPSEPQPVIDPVPGVHLGPPSGVQQTVQPDEGGESVVGPPSGDQPAVGPSSGPQPAVGPPTGESPAHHPADPDDRSAAATAWPPPGYVGGPHTRSSWRGCAVRCGSRR